jgi:predicted small lipoprotein YifL
MKIVVVVISFCLTLGACGQKGPLYLPQPNKPQPEVSAPGPAEPGQVLESGTALKAAKPQREKAASQ